MARRPVYLLVDLSVTLCLALLGVCMLFYILGSKEYEYFHCLFTYSKLIFLLVSVLECAVILCTLGLVFTNLIPE